MHSQRPPKGVYCWKRAYGRSLCDWTYLSRLRPPYECLQLLDPILASLNVHQLQFVLSGEPVVSGKNLTDRFEASFNHETEQQEQENLRIVKEVIKGKDFDNAEEKNVEKLMRYITGYIRCLLCKPSFIHLM